MFYHVASKVVGDKLGTGVKRDAVELDFGAGYSWIMLDLLTASERGSQLPNSRYGAYLL